MFLVVERGLIDKILKKNANLSTDTNIHFYFVTVSGSLHSINANMKFRKCPFFSLCVWMKTFFICTSHKIRGSGWYGTWDTWIAGIMAPSGRSDLLFADPRKLISNCDIWIVILCFVIYWNIFNMRRFLFSPQWRMRHKIREKIKKNERKRIKLLLC
jgi:hypothetical protein